VFTPEPWITVLRNHADATSIRDPLATVATGIEHGGGHQALTVPPGAFIQKHHGGLSYRAIAHMTKTVTNPCPAWSPAPTCRWSSPTAEARPRPPTSRCTPSPPIDSAALLAAATIDIDDCRFRMLKPREHGRAQCFPDSYRHQLNPVLKAAVELPCGSHTITVAGVSSNRLILYSNNSSSSGCGVGLDLAGQNALGDFMDVIAVPRDDLANASLINRVPLAGPATDIRTGCHDAAVIRGSVNLAACASGDTTNVFSIGAPRGGTLEAPQLLYTIQEPGVGQAGTFGRWHSAAFTWDGRVLALGWEPGGGGAPFCTANGTQVPVGGGVFVTQTDTHKSVFFYDAATGQKLGMWTLPRPQSLEENCTIHDYNVVPLRSGRHVLVMGNYQAGTWAADFTDPAHPQTIAWSDPPPLGQVTTPTGELVNELGGAWSSYWYNGFIYESEITKGLNVFRLSDPVIMGPIRLARLNPQTEEFSLP
jgi:hypothetical protein